MTIVIAHDAIHVNIGHLPAGQVAGYTTGSPGIEWTAADWRAHPGAVRIDQDAAASDGTADVLDVERGAATFADCAAWARKALASFTKATRHGQRRPAIYASASSIPAVIGALTAGGLHDVGLWVANWNLTEAEAALEVLASGQHPVIGIQFTDKAVFYDTDVFSSAWLNDQSGPPPPPPVIGKGALGRWVVTLQKDLNGHGAKLKVDGVFGPLTVAAVRSFQKERKLAADGIAGPLTWKALAKP